MDFAYPFSISGELPSRLKPVDNPSNIIDGRASANATPRSIRRSSGNVTSTSNINNDVSFPPLKGISRSKLHDFYVTNEAELTKHISTAAGATEVLWGGDQWFLRWYEAATPSSSPSSSSRGTNNGPESHSIVKHALVPQSHIAPVVDVVLSRFRARRLSWVVGPGDGPCQGLLEVVLINRGLWLEDEQPVMVVDLEKTLPPLLVGGSSTRSTRLMPRDSTASFCGSRSGRQGATTTATAAVTATSTRAFPPPYQLDSEVRQSAFNPVKVGQRLMHPPQFSRLRPRQPEPPQQQPSNSALADYQLQLMLLEQQNKKRLMMQRDADETESAPLEQQGNKLEEEEYRMPITIFEQQSREKMLTQRKLDQMRLKVEEVRKRAEWRNQLMLHYQEMDIEPAKKEREVDSTAVRHPPPKATMYTRTISPSGRALDDYNVQLMLLEQVNKKRLTMARKQHEEEVDAREKKKQQQQSTSGWEQGSQTPPTPHYETLNLLAEQKEGDADMVLVESADIDLVQTGVGVFHTIEKHESEPDDVNNNNNDDDDNKLHNKPEPSPLPPLSAPERKCHVCHNSIMITLLVSPSEVEDWVRTWAHEARGGAPGGDGEADIAHWTSVYRALVSTLPSSQFASKQYFVVYFFFPLVVVASFGGSLKLQKVATFEREWCSRTTNTQASLRLL